MKLKNIEKTEAEISTLLRWQTASIYRIEPEIMSTKANSFDAFGVWNRARWLIQIRAAGLAYSTQRSRTSVDIDYY